MAFAPEEFPIYLIVGTLKYSNKFYPNEKIDGANAGTFPHLLDSQYLKFLLPIHRLLLLPRKIFDFYPPMPIVNKLNQKLSLGQRIILMNSESLDEFFFKQNPIHRVKLVLFEENIPPEKLTLLKKNMSSAFFLKLKDIDQMNVEDIWHRVAKEFNVTTKNGLDAFATNFPPRAAAGQEIPALFYANILNLNSLALNNGLSFASVCASNKIIQDLAEKDAADGQDEKLLSELIFDRNRIPAVILAPGVSNRYIKSLNIKFDPESYVEPTDYSEISNLSPPQQEIVALRVIGTHEALSQSGACLEMNWLPSRVFNLLDDLENHFMQASRPKPSFVWNKLDQISSILMECSNDDVRDSLVYASKVTAYSRFPIGFMKQYKSSSPLALSRPIMYRPTMPLTRVFESQFVTAYRNSVQLKKEMRILFADLTEVADYAGTIARHGTNILCNKISADSPWVTVISERYDSLKDLNAKIGEFKPQLLIITAHGYYEREKSYAGLVVGKQKSDGLDLTNSVPLVFLRSCNVMPFGLSPVSIVDRLLDIGCLSVIGASIPIFADRNNNLIFRFVSELTADREKMPRFYSALDAWFHVLATNIFFDVVMSSDSLIEEFRFLKDQGIDLIEEFFEKVNSDNRIRSLDSLQDTLTLIEEIVKGTSVEKKVKRVIQGRDFVPETLFYKLFGYPDRIFLNEEYRNTI